MEAEEKPTPSSTGAEFGRRVAEFAAGQKAGGGRYTLIKFLGKGGMGVVWLARDEHLRDDVALKFLPADIHHDVEALEDMRRETLKSRKLSHPNIIRIHDLHVAPDESPFISMEYIAGAPLNVLKAQQPQRFFAWEYLKPIVKQLCDALDYAHQQKVIHRDLKPANMMLTTDGVLKLADFGIAAVVSDSMSRISLKHSTSGTVVYMSPEQMNGQRPKPADDIYALGATMYELLTSRPPFYSGDIVHQVQNIEPQPLAERLAELELSNEIPADVSAMVMACLSKDPVQRPVSAGAVAEWIGLQSGTSGARSALVQPEPVAVAAPEVSKPKISPKIRAQLKMVGAIAAGFTVLAVVVGTLMQRNAKEGQDTTKQSKSPSLTVTASNSPTPGSALVTPANVGTRANLPSLPATGWQPLLPAAAQASGGAEPSDGWLKLRQSVYVPGNPSDLALRARLRFLPNSVGISVRESGYGDSYRAEINPKGDAVMLHRDSPVAAERKMLVRAAFSPPLTTGQAYDLAIAAVGDTVTVYVNGPALISERITRMTGRSVIWTRGPADIRDIQWLALPPASSPAASPAPASSTAKQTIDLLALTDPAKDAVRGRWERDGKFLRLLPEGAMSVLEFNYEPPEEYDYTIEFTVTDWGLRQVNQVIACGGSASQWVMGSGTETPAAFGLDVLDGIKSFLPNRSEAVVRRERLSPGVRHVSTVQVRKKGIRALLDGVEVLNWEGNLGRVGNEPQGRLRNPRHLGLSGFAASATFYRIDVSPFIGRENPVAATATKSAPFVNSLGMKFVSVPITGGPTGGQRVLFSIWETRVQDYEVFAKETKREWPKTDYEQKPTEPAVNVSWEDGTAFCAWLTERERKAGKLGVNEKYRLSSDHEWSCAVGIGGQEDAAKLPVSKSEKITDQFPWGTEWPPPRGAGNYRGEDGHPRTAPAGSFNANQFGIYDLGGNVWEVCDDLFDVSPNGRPLRGGTWTMWGEKDRKYSLSSYRYPADSKLRFPLNGFRCVIVPAVLAAAPAASEGWQNLLSRVDVKRDSLMAPWTLEKGVLRSPQRAAAEADDPGSHQTLAFPVANPPQNYDLRLRITRNKRGFAIVVAFVRDGFSGDLRIDGGNGFRLVPSGARKEKQEQLWFPVGKMHEVLVEVRENRVRISHDGKEQVDVAGKIPEGQVDSAFFPSSKMKPPYFGIGVCGGDITVHSAEFRETDRDGKPLAPGASAAGKKKRRQ